jgi:hypothetical protein
MPVSLVVLLTVNGRFVFHRTALLTRLTARESDHVKGASHRQ